MSDSQLRHLFGNILGVRPDRRSADDLWRKLAAFGLPRQIGFSREGEELLRLQAEYQRRESEPRPPETTKFDWQANDLEPLKLVSRGKAENDGIGSRSFSLISGGAPLDAAWQISPQLPPKTPIDVQILSEQGKSTLVGGLIKKPQGSHFSYGSFNRDLECPGKFALLLSVDYLNGVVHHRFEPHRKNNSALSFDWSRFAPNGELPEVETPSDYQAPQEGGKWPGDYQAPSVEWEPFGPPRVSPANLSQWPATGDPVATMHLAFWYRLSKSHYTWVAKPTKPEYQSEVWWLDSLNPPMLEGLPIDPADYTRLAQKRLGDFRPALPAGQGEFTPISDRFTPPDDVRIGGIHFRWFPATVVTDEHIYAEFSLEIPLHFEVFPITGGIKILPELRMTYGDPRISLEDLRVSEPFRSLATNSNVLTEAVRQYLKPFLDRHPFRPPLYSAEYLPLFAICSELFTSREVQAIGPQWRVGSVWSIQKPNTSRLWIQRVGPFHLRINFDFLDIF